ncbi:FAD linked oxidase family protein (macronuclear) [Tetrahymena thermophila SB210]|uniref:FAD linked oxidase family protein n=1 Tax=Tetrahymena thermophila (strain SB210) TaxID=312017 RepID=I7MFB3_TETTS|nr:FAD linked oxidase family protein [Tetrahymena thermophila SB210]EAR83770.1 FAD linked oxidase family protein [Tetrahymena thermophila SB210]|eukprot:XP_001031433.1 FAD linked oxidase family protein [Tetrahymena thermophila SB210]
MIYSAKRFFSLAKKPRNPNHRSIQKQDLEYFQSILSESEIITSDLSKYNVDWMSKYHGDSKLVLLPNSTQKISQILSYCNTNMLPVVPQSGNTGLVGGSVPHYDEIILSLQRLNKIIDYDTNNDIVTTESGVILENLNQYLSQFNTEAPYDLGAKGSCFVGGNIATHAGGKYLVKHGPLRGYVLGLEVVLANGQIMNLLNKSRKDNTGIDLKQIFIGSEGSLGIITKANLLCVKKAIEKNLLFIKTSSFQNILQIHNIAKSEIGKNLAAIEWMDSYAYKAVMENIKTAKDVFDSQNKIDQSYYVLIEINTNFNKDLVVEQFYNSLSQVEGLVSECVLAQNDHQFDELWKIRELVGSACGHIGKVFKYDISLNTAQMDDITKDLRQKCIDLGFTVGYGHIGDGNLHINISCLDKTKEQQLENQIEPYIFEWLSKKGGSISAEHGLGLMKADYLHLQKKPEVIDCMKNIKKIFDPNLILNPYKILPGI